MIMKERQAVCLYPVFISSSGMVHLQSHGIKITASLMSAYHLQQLVTHSHKKRFIYKFLSQCIFYFS